MPQSQGKVKSQLEHRQDVNKWAAVIIPLVLLGIVGYAIWVVVVLVGVNYLLQPDATLRVAARPGAGIAIITIFFLLLLPMAVSYIQTVRFVFHEPTYVPTGPESRDLKRVFVEEPLQEIELPCCKTTTGTQQEDDSRKRRVTGNTRDIEKQITQEQDPNYGKRGYYISPLDIDAIFRGTIAPPPGMSEFYTRPIFQCDPSGLPIWCTVCRTYKPDRAHHCSDNGRCAYKLDHFCPWVGGALGETNFKFFLQFNFWGALFCIHVTAVMGWAIGERTARSGAGSVDVAWIILVALSALFLSFTGGMAITSAQHVFANLTTVDAIDAAKRTVFVAVRLREGQTAPMASNHLDAPAPIGPPGAGGRKRDLSIPWQGTIAYPFVVNGQPVDEHPRRTFAILCTPPGLNPWDLGAAGNWREVMGHGVLDWLVPLKMSPCVQRRTSAQRGSMYRLGPKFRQMLINAGIEPETIMDDEEEWRKVRGGREEREGGRELRDRRERTKRRNSQRPRSRLRDEDTGVTRPERVVHRGDHTGRR